MNMQTLLKGMPCTCGREHTCAIEHVFVEHNAIARLPEICGDFQHILIVADENTYGVAGEKVEAYIGNKVIARQIFSGKTVLIPNEAAIEAVKGQLSGIDLIVGIGSGVIQDLCKYTSHFEGIPYYIVATAPSMDGYASSGAAMITEGMKVTYAAKVPEGIIADTSIIKDAPLEMIKAGYGDIVGKFSSLNDWKLAHIVNGEYFCQNIYDLTEKILRKTLPLSEKLLQRDEEAIRTLTEALIIVGIALSFVGNSRPASGSEHHLSHFFEITGIVNGEEYLPHGIDVAFSAIITSAIREKLRSKPFPRTGFVTDRAFYEQEMSRVYKSVAPGCIALQDSLGTYTADRMPAYLANEEKLKEILAEVPSEKEMTEILKGIGLELPLFHSYYSKDKLRDAVRYAKDLKDRYTVLWMYYDLYGLEEV